MWMEDQQIAEAERKMLEDQGSSTFPWGCAGLLCTGDQKTWTGSTHWGSHQGKDKDNVAKQLCGTARMLEQPAQCFLFYSYDV